MQGIGIPPIMNIMNLFLCFGHAYDILRCQFDTVPKVASHSI